MRLAKIALGLGLPLLCFGFMSQLSAWSEKALGLENYPRCPNTDQTAKLLHSMFSNDISVMHVPGHNTKVVAMNIIFVGGRELQIHFNDQWVVWNETNIFGDWVGNIVVRIAEDKSSAKDSEWVIRSIHYRDRQCHFFRVNYARIESIAPISELKPLLVSGLLNEYRLFGVLCSFANPYQIEKIKTNHLNPTLKPTQAETTKLKETHHRDNSPKRPSHEPNIARHAQLLNCAISDNNANYEELEPKERFEQQDARF